MRLFQTAVLCATLALPSIAHAQSKKVQGSSLAGLCAAAVEFVAGARSAAGVAQPRELQVLQRTRDLFLGSPGFPAGEVEGYANAWSRRITEELTSAPDDATRGRLAQQIGKDAQKCQQQMFQKVRAEQQQRGTIQPTPKPAPIQPLTTEPYTTVPLDTQPLTTQPYVIQ